MTGAARDATLHPMKLALAAAILLLVAGCGSSSVGTEAGSPRASKADQCRSLLAPAKDAVQGFASRFESGLSRDQFNDRAGDLRVALGRVDASAPGVLGERCDAAYNELVKSEQQAAMIVVSWDSCEASAQFAEAASCKSSKDLTDAAAYVRNLREFATGADAFIAQVG